MKVVDQSGFARRYWAGQAGGDDLLHLALFGEPQEKAPAAFQTTAAGAAAVRGEGEGEEKSLRRLICVRIFSSLLAGLRNYPKILTKRR